MHKETFHAFSGLYPHQVEGIRFLIARRRAVPTTWDWARPGRRSSP
jgi:hypothetical protein